MPAATALLLHASDPQPHDWWALLAFALVTAVAGWLWWAWLRRRRGG